ncbi:asparaginase [Paenibacillus psychroresistens]|uniref:asparaginase n=1 Tax=Paenibacillus psychroresistens TaxID=1778678 RepID=UPI001391CFEA|nr:asparaginase domain-containing protein [Paenibacillus psychroresistens]
MKKIKVIFTGGTIGSRKTERNIDVDVAASYELIRLYGAFTPSRQIEFDTVQPLNILSENLVPEDWLTMIKELENIDYSLYEGIIVTHGTDTLPFTAAALSLASQGIPIPIMLIASNFPLNDPRGKGVLNFSHAVDFIMEQCLAGVFVIFENSQGEAIVHLGTRLSQSDPFTDEYDSTYSAPFGVMSNHQFIHNTHAINPSVAKLQSQSAPEVNNVPWSFSNEVLYLRPYPGLNYRYYDFSKSKPVAVLHDLYHSGTASTRNSDVFDASILHFLAYCQSHEVTVYIAPIKNKAGDLYASSHLLLEAGAIPLENISVETALVKLMLAYGSFKEHSQILQFMQETSLFFEIHQTS